MAEAGGKGAHITVADLSSLASSHELIQVSHKVGDE